MCVYLTKFCMPSVKKNVFFRVCVCQYMYVILPMFTLFSVLFYALIRCVVFQCYYRTTSLPIVI